MQNSILFPLSALVIAIASGCTAQPVKTSSPTATTSTPTMVSKDTQVSEKTYEGLPICDTPIATVRVVDFKCNTQACQIGAVDSRAAALLRHVSSLSGDQSLTDLGPGISDMLISTLSQTRCFEIVERETLNELREEMALSGVELKANSAQFLITGAVSSANQDQSSVGVGGLLGLNRSLPVVGGINTSKKTANLGVDVRLVSVQDARVVSSKTYQASQNKRGFEIDLGGFSGTSALGARYKKFEGTAWEEAIRDVVAQATYDLTNQIK